MNFDDDPISSTRVRQAITRGAVSKAASMLGKHFGLQGKVVSGDKIGRTIGFPTANLADYQQITPSPGVYCGYVTVADSSVNLNRVPAVFNVGFRPSVASVCRVRHRCQGNLRLELL